MKDEKILHDKISKEKILNNENSKEEILEDEQLDKVSGGAPRIMFASIDTNKFSNILGLTASIPNR